MKIVEAEAKNNQQSKSNKMGAKRMAEVWRWLPADMGNAATATAMQQAKATRQWRCGNGNGDGCGCGGCSGSLGNGGGRWLR